MDRVDPVFGGDDLFADALDAVVDEELRVGQTADVLTHQVGELGADLLDAGYESQADLVAQVFGRAVRRIFPVGNVLCYGVFEDVLARSEHSVVVNDYAAALLPSVLQGIETVIGEIRHGAGLG